MLGGLRRLEHRISSLESYLHNRIINDDATEPAMPSEVCSHINRPSTDRPLPHPPKPVSPEFSYPGNIKRPSK
jgi:hypothetical protein